MIDELEKSYRKELQFQIKHWRDRATTSERYLRMILNEFPEANAYMIDKAKCDVKRADVQCKNCDCWKRNQKGPSVNEP